MYRLVCLALYTAAIGLSQSAPAFDAASVRIHSGPAVEQSGAWIQTTAGGVTMRNAKLSWCLGWAYDKKEWMIFGPEWVDSERYDILAKTDQPTALSQLKLMMQTLLQDRFRLALRHETKELPVLVLAASKKGSHSLTPAAAAGSPDGPRPLGGNLPNALVYKNVSMSDFAERLGAPAPLGVEDKVVDATNLPGVFDITLKLDGIDQVGGRNQFIDLLKACLEQQFGLVLEHRKMAIDTIIVERGTRIPTEN